MPLRVQKIETCQKKKKDDQRFFKLMCQCDESEQQTSKPLVFIALPIRSEME